MTSAAASSPSPVRRRRRVVAGVRAPVPRRRARGPRPRQPRARRPHRDARQLPRRARRSRSPAARRWAGCVPATVEPVVLKAELADPRSPARWSRARWRWRTAAASAGSSWCRPTSPPPPTRSTAIAAADQVVLRPRIALHQRAPGAVRRRPARRHRGHPGPGRAGRQPPPAGPRDLGHGRRRPSWRPSWPTAPGSTASSTTPATACRSTPTRLAALLGVRGWCAAPGRAGRRARPRPCNSWHRPSVLCCSQPISTSRCGGVQWRFV